MSEDKITKKTIDLKDYDVREHYPNIAESYIHYSEELALKYNEGVHDGLYDPLDMVNTSKLYNDPLIEIVYPKLNKHYPEFMEKYWDGVLSVDDGLTEHLTNEDLKKYQLEIEKLVDDNKLNDADQKMADDLGKKIDELKKKVEFITEMSPILELEVTDEDKVKCDEYREQIKELRAEQYLITSKAMTYSTACNQVISKYSEEYGGQTFGELFELMREKFSKRKRVIPEVDQKILDLMTTAQKSHYNRSILKDYVTPLHKKVDLSDVLKLHRKGKDDVKSAYKEVIDKDATTES